MSEDLGLAPLPLPLSPLGRGEEDRLLPFLPLFPPEPEGFDLRRGRFPEPLLLEEPLLRLVERELRELFRDEFDPLDAEGRLSLLPRPDFSLVFLRLLVRL